MNKLKSRAGRAGRWGLFVVAVATGAANSACAVRWNLNYGDGMTQAQQTKRPMLLYFKDWSSSEHRNLVSQVFESPPVSKELKDTINVELLYNWGDEARRYKITNPQICVFCRPDGSEVGRLYLVPQPTPEKFAEWIRKCKSEIAGPTSVPAGKPPAKGAAAPKPATSPPAASPIPPTERASQDRRESLELAD